MSLTAYLKKRQFPLHVHISAVFTLLLLLIGIALAVFNYLQTTRIILDSSQKQFNQIAQDVQQDLLNTYQPIRHALNLLALNPNAMTDSFETRMGLLHPFAQALEDNPRLSALFIGDNQGNFFLVRPLRNQAIKTRINAPQQSAYSVWTLKRFADSSEVESKKLFFDDSLTLLEERNEPNQTYDPRQRSWFIPARASIDHTTTDPYLFFTTQEAGTTLSKRSTAKAVIGADLSLSQLSETLARHRVTPNTQIVLFDAEGRVVAYPDSDQFLTDKNATQLPEIGTLNPALKLLTQHSTDEQQQLSDGNRQWITSQASINDKGSNTLKLALMVPEEELLADAYQLRWEGMLVTLAILLLCLPLGWLTSRLMVKPLKTLVGEAEAIRRFDFNYPIKQHSPVLEIDQLEMSMRRMKETLSSFFEITASLSAHTRFEPLLQSVLVETIKIAQAQAGLIYLMENEGTQLVLKGVIVNDQPQTVDLLTSKVINLQQDSPPEWLRALCDGNDSVVRTFTMAQAAELKPVMQALDSQSVHVIGIRLHNRHGETVGVLALLLNNTGTPADQEHLRSDRIAFIKAVSGAAAVSIESQRLQDRQKQLLNAFIKLLAGAIDAKSPYTAGHCQRVPVLTFMLAEAAAASQLPEFAQYNPTDDEWEALHIAAWMHDCGKVTTPEYVVDKATKLETLYDRIHEVRTRFEVLKRDAWINYWQARALGGDDQQLTSQRDATLSQLDDDFAFVARSNLGGEAMAAADLQRLSTIAKYTWTRTLDDRLGVSWEENKRQEGREEQSLPVTEWLLDDKPEHLFLGSVRKVLSQAPHSAGQ